MTTQLSICTNGPFFGIIESHAKNTLGLPIAPYRFVRQQDIKLDGVEVFPREWEGKDHNGVTVKQTFNGGWPGMHDHIKPWSGAYKLGPWEHGGERCILDLEPENWQAWFKGDDPRRIIDAFDVIRTTVDASGAAALAFTFYPEMWGRLIQSVPGFEDWWQSLPLCCIDGYLYDAADRDAWTRREYDANIQANLNTLGYGVPSRKIRVFQTVNTSGDRRPHTEAEERMMADVLNAKRLHHRFIWLECDTQKQALASCALLTPERVRWMREGGGG